MGTESMKTMTRIRRWLAVGLLFAVSPACLAQVAETVTYYYTNQQGTPLATADASGNILTTSDYRPYGSQVLGSPAGGPGYTGHVNDPDSGLVYMQARYYDPVVGRFLAADAVLPDAGYLASFNRYSYVGDNPVMRIDPTGDYLCQGSKAQCAKISNALQDVASAAKKLPGDSSGKAVLNDIVNFYGQEGVDNHVNVAFGSAYGNNSVTETSGNKPADRITTITFNFTNVKLTGSNPGTNFAVELAGAVAHEGANGIIGRKLGQPSNRESLKNTEIGGFTAQSYVNEGKNTTSPYGLWKSGWSETPKNNAARDAAAKSNAHDVAYPKSAVP
jgi:RHS repeat-associated protein